MSFVLCCIIFGILVFCSETDGGSLTWEQPLPTQTVQSSNPVDHFSSRQLHEGTIHATLNWRFRLNQLNFGSLVISKNGRHIAGIGSSGSGPQAGFENEYGIDWNPNQKLVKLFIFNVTTEKNGTFTCQVNADEVTGFVTKNFQFRSAIQVDVVGQVGTLVPSINEISMGVCFD
ncbi:PREDICTED: uncharacterized protein LOC107343545 isoform X2 [Acropora digitifera]|uniref:uncharacterized protein LOC107343545 isoform X2 n=1 Tax=Acropora digitifera TaxID=70779 RepID=UPI00077B1273|nr:PREDICTED: uncharacterized protein LOC107343545 isoform X2 [Acropora digitifera]